MPYRKLYCKPEDIPIFINANSTQPCNIKKQLTKMISSRLSKNSYRLQELNEALQNYQSAPEKSGHRKK